MKWKATKNVYNRYGDFDGYNLCNYPNENAIRGSETEFVFIRTKSIPRMKKIYNIFVEKFEDYQSQGSLNKKVVKRIISLEKRILRYSDILVAINECIGDKNGR